MANEGVIKLKGDASNLDQAVEKSSQGFRRLGEHAAKAHGHARSFGEQWQHANNHMIRTVAHGLSIAAVVEKIIDKMKEFQEASEHASKTFGGIAVDRGLAAQRMGLSNAEAERLTGGDSPISEADRVKYFSSLADKKFGRGRARINGEQAETIMAAYRSGTVGEGEIDQAIEKGDLSGITNYGDRFAGLSEEAKTELVTRQSLNAFSARTESVLAPNGRLRSIAGANRALRDAEHPWAVDSLIGMIPGAAQLGDSLYKERGVNNSNIANELRAAVDQQTKDLQADQARFRKPTVAKPAGGD